jgi:hypothetical protein
MQKIPRRKTQYAVSCRDKNAGRTIMALALYHNDMSSCAQKVRLTLAEKGLEWESRHLDLRAGEHQK